jgi:3-phenylpropionate/cinnamic acid dioxygenase small subunit
MTKRSYDASALALRAEIEDFLFDEAELLDRRQFGEWLDTLDDDLVYFMPLRRNVPHGHHAERENTRFGKDISWFDEDKWTLQKRVEQIQTGIHWSEEPLSRVTHLVSNVQIRDVETAADEPVAVTAHSRFLIYQNRAETETYTFVGRRIDRIVRRGESWKLARREILLEQNVLLAKNLTVFF